jgi:hypothetical protein
MKPVNGLMRWSEAHAFVELVFDGTRIDHHHLRYNVPVLRQSTTISKILPVEHSQHPDEVKKDRAGDSTSTRCVT